MVSEKRLRKLRDPDYREEYLKSTVTAWIVHQMRALRNERGWTQGDLADKAGGVPQSAIGRYESEHYGNWNTNTLLKLAKAFGVALEIRFVSWPKFMRDTEDTSPAAMYVPSFSPTDFAVEPNVYQRFGNNANEQSTQKSRLSGLEFAPYQQMDRSEPHRSGLH